MCENLCEFKVRPHERLQEAALVVGELSRCFGTARKDTHCKLPEAKTDRRMCFVY